jgi:acyl-CoA reductase-like NAD-dependent aldehyde dehydrogenase
LSREEETGINAYSLLIGGRAVDAKSRLDVINPSTGAIVGEMPLGSPQDLDDAVRAATEAFAF